MRTIADLPRARAPLGVRLGVFLGLVALVAPARAAEPEPRLPVVEVADARRSSLPDPDLEPFLGVAVAPGSGGLRVVDVVPGSSAAASGLLRDDVLVALDGRPLRRPDDLDRAVLARVPLEVVRVDVRRGGELAARSVRLGARRPPDEYFRGSRFRLAVVQVGFADEPEPQDRRADLERMLFARTGRTGPGASLRDYWLAQSGGRLDVTGRVLAPVVVAGARDSFAAMPMGAPQGSLFQCAAAALGAREGRAALAEFDGVAFLHEGAPETRPGRALWPHRSSVEVGGRRLPYFVHCAAEDSAIGVHCHEFGHLIGLPDAYGVGHRTGSGDFCLMAIGHRGGPAHGPASPFSLCAWCRSRFGWVEPVRVDPRTPQRIRLRPASGRDSGALLVPLTSRVDEYLLLEVRAREGFDRELPSAGLLVWRVGGASTPGQGSYGSRVDLVEAHGIDVFDASLVRTGEIAFPTARARDLTPHTVPSTASSSAGSLRVDVTDIVRERDGSVVLTLGVPRAVVQTLPAYHDPGPVADDGTVTRVDPVTGEEVRFFVGQAGGPVPMSGTGAESGEERR